LSDATHTVQVADQGSSRAAWLIDKTGYNLVPALYIMLASAFSALAALSIHPESRKAIADSVIPHDAVAAAAGR